jgi:hypothetical protein
MQLAQKIQWNIPFIVYAGIAQLVEQRFCKAKVVGSSPSSGSKIKSPVGGFYFGAGRGVASVLRSVTRT